MSSEEQWISIVDWEREYQHYDPQKRLQNPRGSMPWIKNYTRLMQNDEYLELTEHCALILHRLWLVYAMSACRLRADTRSLSRKTGLRVTKSHLVSLNHAGFIELVDSRELAEGYLASSTRVTRVEVEVEIESTSSQSGSKTTGETHTTLEPPEDFKESDNEHEHERELVRFSDDNGLAPAADSVEEIREAWSSWSD